MNLENAFRFSPSGTPAVLPDGYVQLEYVQNSGKQYIDLGLYPSTLGKVSVTYETVALGSNYLCGARINDNLYSVIMGTTSGNTINATMIRSASSAQSVTSDIRRTIGHVYEVTAEAEAHNGEYRTKIVVNDLTGAQSATNYGTDISGTPVTTERNMYLFAVNSSNIISGIKLYTYKYWDNDRTLLRDMVPCKNSDNVVGMYDLVGKQFYANVGTGDFTAGPAVEVTRITKDGNVMWQRAVAKDSTKGVASSFDNTRVAKNLFDNNNITDNITISSTDGSESTQLGASCSTNIIPVKPSTDYVNDSSATNPGNIRWHEYDANGNWINSAAYVVNGGTFKTGSTTYGLRYSKNTAKSTIQSYNIQLNEGSTAEPYYPYFAPTTVLPSAKAYGKAISATPQEELWGRYVPIQPTNSAKYLMTLEGWAYRVIDGTEELGVSTNECWNFVDYPSKGPAQGANYCYCNLLPSTNTNESTGEARRGHAIPSSYGTCLGFRYNGEGGTTDSATAKSWFKAKYDSGNPYIVLYDPLNTSTDMNWIAVKDIVANTCGYYDRENKVYIPVYEMTGTEIKRIDYLQSSGTQYIDTGITLSNESNVHIKYQYVQGTVSGRVIGDATSNSAKWLISCASAIPNSPAQIGWAGTWYPPSSDNFPIPNYDVMIVNIDGRDLSMTKGGETKSTTLPENEFVTEGTAYLFGASTGFAWCRIYECSADGLSFVPVKIGATGYMLDTIEWKLYANDGTGDFTCGPEIPNRLIVPYILSGNKGEIYYENGAVHADGEHDITVRSDNLFGGTFNQRFTFDSPIPAGTLIYASGDNTSSQCYVRYYDQDGNTIVENRLSSTQSDRRMASYTPAVDVYACMFYNASIGNLKVGSSVEYDPYMAPITKQVQDLLYSATSYKDLQTGEVYQDYTAVWYDGTQTIPSGYISQTGDLTPNQIVIYPLATPVTESGTADAFRLTTKGNKTITTSVDGTQVQVGYLGE